MSMRLGGRESNIPHDNRFGRSIAVCVCVCTTGVQGYTWLDCQPIVTPGRAWPGAAGRMQLLGSAAPLWGGSGRAAGHQWWSLSVSVIIAVSCLSSRINTMRWHALRAHCQQRSSLYSTAVVANLEQEESAQVIFPYPPVPCYPSLDLPSRSPSQWRR